MNKGLKQAVSHGIPERWGRCFYRHRYLASTHHDAKNGQPSRPDDTVQIRKLLRSNGGVTRVCGIRFPGEVGLKEPRIIWL